MRRDLPDSDAILPIPADNAGRQQDPAASAEVKSRIGRKPERGDLWPNTGLDDRPRVQGRLQTSSAIRS